MKKVSGIIFDMDGLLFDTEQIYYDASQVIADKMDFQYDEALYDRFIGVSDEELWQNYHEIFAAHGKANVQKFIDESYALALKTFNTQGAPLKPGAKELLDFLAAEDIPRVLASSNQRPVIETLLNKAGLTERFAAIVSADDVKRAKPDPEIFQLALTKLETTAETTLVLEDSHNGILAAEAAQIPVVMIPDRIPASPELTEKAHAVLPDLHAVISYLKK